MGGLDYMSLESCWVDAVVTVTAGTKMTVFCVTALAMLEQFLSCECIFEEPKHTLLLFPKTGLSLARFFL